MLLTSVVLAAVLASAPEQDAFVEAQDRGAKAAEERARAEEQRSREMEKRVRADEERQRAMEERARQEEAYERATQAMDEAEWEKAAALFDQAADAGGRKTDGALYWKAYSQAKLGRRAEALAAIEALRRAHPQSRWVKEAKALEMEIRQQSGTPEPPQSVEDEELKLMALNGLMNSNPDEAVPMLEQFLSGKGSRKLQDRALFVLSQSRSPKAREIVVQAARGKSHPDLQRKAIQYLGLFGSEESRQALDQIYAETGDESVKKAVLHAFMVSGRKGPVLAAAQREKDPELRAAAVHTLGVMGARTELWTMYQSETDRELRKNIMHALFVGGAQQQLEELARGEKDRELRLEAIHKLGLMGGRSSETLVAMYRGAENDREVREAVMQAFFLQGNARALVEIARTEKDPELKKVAVSKLSLMNSKEGTEYLLELLKK